jgi:tetratricopeptide (TPR) repeat protein
MKLRAQIILAFTTILPIFIHQQNARSANSYSLLQQGIIEANNGKSEKGLRLFNTTIQQNSSLVEAYLERGKIKIRLGKYREAVEDYDRAILGDRKLVSAYLERGNAKREFKQYQSAIKDYDEAITLNPRSASAYVWRGVTYRVNLKQKEKGDLDFNIALKLKPQSPIEYWERALIYGLKKDYQAGLDYFNSISSSDNKNSSYVYSAKGYLYEKMERFDLAAIEHEKFIQSKDKFAQSRKPIVLEWLISDYSLLKEHSKVISTANKLIRLDPKNHQAFLHRGQAFYQLKNYSAAVTDFNKSSTISAKDYWSYYWRGATYIQLDNLHFKQAILDLDRAIILWESSTNKQNFSDGYSLYSMRGAAKICAIQIPQALADFKQALNLAQKEGNPKSIEAAKQTIKQLETYISFAALLTSILLLAGALYFSKILMRQQQKSNVILKIKP